jgi:hypothetical protein
VAMGGLATIQQVVATPLIFLLLFSIYLNLFYFKKIKIKRGKINLIYIFWEIFLKFFKD